MSYFGTIYAEDIPHRAKSVYMYLRDRTNASGTCWPGIKKIATDLHLSRSTVKRALDDLYKSGLIKKEPRYRDNGSNSSNLYTVETVLP
jgi:DNA-binding MarR family transcriptional regulator